MKNKPKPGAKTKYEQPALSWIQCRVPRRFKAAWVKRARKRGLNLSEHVIQTLNADVDKHAR